MNFHRLFILTDYAYLGEHTHVAYLSLTQFTTLMHMCRVYTLCESSRTMEVN